jgi:hypothetical protein
MSTNAKITQMQQGCDTACVFNIVGTYNMKGNFPWHCLQVKQLLSSTMDEVTSSLHMNDGLGVQNLVLSAVGLGE